MTSGATRRPARLTEATVYGRKVKSSCVAGFFFCLHVAGISAYNKTMNKRLHYLLLHVTQIVMPFMCV